MTGRKISRECASDSLKAALRKIYRRDEPLASPREDNAQNLLVEKLHVSTSFMAARRNLPVFCGHAMLALPNKKRKRKPPPFRARAHPLETIT